MQCLINLTSASSVLQYKISSSEKVLLILDIIVSFCVTTNICQSFLCNLVNVFARNMFKASLFSLLFKKTSPN